MGGRGYASAMSKRQKVINDINANPEMFRGVRSQLPTETREIFSKRADLEGSLYKLGGMQAIKKPQDLVLGEIPLGMTQAEYDKHVKLANARMTEYKNAVRKEVVAAANKYMGQKKYGSTTEENKATEEAVKRAMKDFPSLY